MENLHLNSTSKSIVIALMAILALSFAIPLRSASAARFPGSDFEMFGPRVDQMLVTFRGEPTGTFTALDTHAIDIVDWPLDADWVNEWTGRSDIIMLDEGGEFGLFILDMLENQTKQLVSGYNVDYYVATGDPTPITVTLHGETFATTRGAQMRHAIAHLTDRNYIVNTILGGFGAPIYSVVPPTYGALSNPDVDIHPFDVNEAKAILAAAGFVDTDSNGFVNKAGGTLPDGRPIGTGDVIIDFLFRGGPRGRFAQESFIPAMGLAGIKLNLEGPVAFGVAYDKVFTSRRKDLYTGGWSGLNTPDYLAWLYGSVGWEPPPAFPNNYMRYCAGRDANNDGINEFDPTMEAWYNTILTSPVLDDVNAAFFAAQVYMQDKSNVYTNALWMSSAPKAYSLYNNLGPGAGNEWKGIVNQRAFGINSIWTSMSAHTDNNPDSGLLREGVSASDMVSANILYCSSYFDFEILEHIYDSLMSFDPDTPNTLGPPTMKPWMAQTMENTQENDPQQGGALVTTIKFYLRNDIYWHDGVRFNASDVEFSLQSLHTTLAARGFPVVYWQSAVSDISHVDIQDEFTVKVWMKTLSIFHLRNVGFAWMLPKHVWNPIVSTGSLALVMSFAPDSQLIGSNAFKVYPKNVIVGDPNSVYVPGTSFLLKAYKPKAGYAAGPTENMLDPNIPSPEVQYIGFFRYGSVQVEDPVQTLNDQGGVQEYVILYNYGTTAATVRVRVWLNSQTPGNLLYDSGTPPSLVIPAATGGGAFPGLYLLTGVTIPANSGLIIVRVTPPSGVDVPVVGAFVSSASIPGDATTSGNTALDKVNVFDAILLSTAWGGAAGQSTSQTITGPWKTPNADFNDDNTCNAADGALLSLNYAL